MRFSQIVISCVDYTLICWKESQKTRILMFCAV